MKSHIVEKRNEFNEMRIIQQQKPATKIISIGGIETKTDNGIERQTLTIQQAKFLAIYLSRINPRDITTKEVRLSTQEFLEIMDIVKPQKQGQPARRFNRPYITKQAKKMLFIAADYEGKNGKKGGGAFTLFSSFFVGEDDNGTAEYIEIEANEKALPLFFDFKEKYFTYEVENVLRLPSIVMIRMYEVLKQRQNMTQPVIIQLQELKRLLWIDQDAYQDYKYFRKNILETAKERLTAQTDITFTYSPVRAGRKVAALAFTIDANIPQFPQMSIEEWEQAQPEESGGPSSLPEPENANSGRNQIQSAEAAPDPGEAAPVFMPEELELYAEALPEGMTAGEVDALQNLARKHIEGAANRFEADTMIFDYLQEKTKLMNAQHPKVKNRFAWLKKAIAEDWK